jgi:hypothetical protein
LVPLVLLVLPLWLYSMLLLAMMPLLSCLLLLLLAELPQ